MCLTELQDNVAISKKCFRSLCWPTQFHCHVSPTFVDQNHSASAWGCHTGSLTGFSQFESKIWLKSRLVNVLGSIFSALVLLCLVCYYGALAKAENREQINDHNENDVADKRFEAIATCMWMNNKVTVSSPLPAQRSERVVSGQSTPSVHRPVDIIHCRCFVRGCSLDKPCLNRFVRGCSVGKPCLYRIVAWYSSCTKAQRQCPSCLFCRLEGRTMSCENVSLTVSCSTARNARHVEGFHSSNCISSSSSSSRCCYGSCQLQTPSQAVDATSSCQLRVAAASSSGVAGWNVPYSSSPNGTLGVLRSPCVSLQGNK